MNSLFINISLFVNNVLKNINTTLTRILLALIIFFVGFIIGKVLEKAIYRILKDNKINNKLEKRGLKINAEEILSYIVSYTIYIITILYALETLNIANTLLTFILLVFMFLILISIFITMIDIIPNFISGLYLYKTLETNKNIKIDNIEGKIIKKELFHVVIETKKGDIIYIPNKNFLNINLQIRK